MKQSKASDRTFFKSELTKTTMLSSIKNRALSFFLIFISSTILLLSLPVVAEGQSVNYSLNSEKIDADIIPRVVHKDAIVAITTREKSVDLLLTNQALVIQFSDHFLNEIEQKITDRAGEDNSHLGNVIKNMVSSGVKTLLDRAMTIPLHDISNIFYRDGELFIETADGKYLFEELEIDDIKIMRDFSRRDARKFVTEAEKILP